MFYKETESPSDEFIRLFTAKIYNGRLTQSVLEDFSHIIKNGWKKFLTDNVNYRLKSALNVSDIPENNVPESPEKEEKQNDNGIVTTDEEIDAFHIIKAILREDIPASRIVMRDTKSYCGVLLDDNNRKPICRLHFNYSQKYLGIISNKKEERIPIETVDDIYSHAERLKSVIAEYS